MNSPIDPVPQCDHCGDHHGRDEFQIEVRDGRERLTCPTCGKKFDGRELAVETDGGADLDIVFELTDETHNWIIAGGQPWREDVSREVLAFSLATFVDGVAISPLGFDETEQLDGLVGSP